MLTALRESFTTNTRKLNYTNFPMRLWQKAKKFGIWNPSDTDFSQDIKDWAALNNLEQDEFVNFAVSQFQKRIARVERARGLSLVQVLGEESLQFEQEEVV